MKKKEKKSFLRRLIKKSLLLFAYLILVFFVISVFSPYVSPARYWFPAFAGLMFPYLFALLIIFFFLLLLRRYKIHLLIFIPFLVAGFLLMGRYYKTGWFNSKKKDLSYFKVMSFNVRLFDLYNWKSNDVNRKKIFQYLLSENPDIVCFQEYYFQKGGNFATTTYLKNTLAANNVHTVFPVINKNRYFFGIATFSKYPVVNKGEISFKGTTNTVIYTDIATPGDTIRVYNCHLESIRLSHEDYKFIDKFDLEVNKKEVQETKSILRRLKKSFVKRTGQINLLTEHIKSCRYPVIVCGDFNDTPVSYSYRKLTQLLRDSFSESGKGSGTTYNGKFPLLRIDYIFHDKKFHSYNFRTDAINLSDHFPIKCELAICD